MLAVWSNDLKHIAMRSVDSEFFGRKASLTLRLCSSKRQSACSRSEMPRAAIKAFPGQPGQAMGWRVVLNLRG